MEITTGGAMRLLSVLAFALIGSSLALGTAIAPFALS
jgi:hypothetical protein